MKEDTMPKPVEPSTNICASQAPLRQPGNIRETPANGTQTSDLGRDLPASGSTI